MPPIRYTLCENCEMTIFTLICGTYFTKNRDFRTKQIIKYVKYFCFETCFGKVVYNVNTHVCAHLNVGETSDNPVDPLKTPQSLYKP